MVVEGLQKDCYVVYGSNGICRIDDIKNTSFTADMADKLYYILNPVRNPESRIFVPADNDVLVSKMRKIMTKEEIEELLLGMKGKEIEWESDRRCRNESFNEILTKGVTQDMLLMIRCLYMKKRELAENGKNLPTSDNNTLKSAEKLVEEEFSYTLGIKPSEVSGYIRGLLYGFTE